ncbi:hypothetical protein [Nocardia bovistercoris]|uniref:Uncharacterized protein n=1 Tax=Nocardia bovistercoris TaxID=2785916 RepID=A0A931MYV7_9NOCA|nr:hypothetical protein [Nocardia bovistercoris]MBH0775460.1 hypothetical protein [Nocardia bovistercoris]
MRLGISVSALWRHLRRGLLLYGASVGGSMQCYQEALREQADLDAAAVRAELGHERIDLGRCDAERWDWSVPNLWYDVAHRD